jgi:hypothetical protein
VHSDDTGYGTPEGKDVSGHEEKVDGLLYQFEGQSEMGPKSGKRNRADFGTLDRKRDLERPIDVEAVAKRAGKLEEVLDDAPGIAFGASETGGADAAGVDSDRDRFHR